MEIRKPPTEAEVVEWLKDGRVVLPPVRLELAKVRPQYGRDRQWDFEVNAIWAEEKAAFAVEYRSLFTPKVFEETLRRCRDARLPKGCLPMMLLPYLRPSQLDELVALEISGVDLCGNGVVIVPNGFRVFRGGAPNHFSSYSPIKNIYRKNTSMVARVFFTDTRFSSVQEVLLQINGRNVLASATGKTPMTLGTVSKALKQLEDELIIDRAEGVRLLQPEKLLDNLQQNYEPDRSAKRMRLKVDCAFDQLPQRLKEVTGDFALPFMVTGLSSVSRYAVMQRGEMLSLYCPKIGPLQKILRATETDRFPNVELIETSNEPLYFDAQRTEGVLWASPVQTYLELMAGDKRDRETAGQVKDKLLRHAGGVER